VLTSESPRKTAVSFRDAASNRTISAELPAGGASLILVRKNGDIAARYDREFLRD
jgi:hypothetical protein